ncbi:MAG: hypothetical protein NVS9B8_06340 [Candidatus Limnocylindrales bacterium]
MTWFARVRLSVLALAIAAAAGSAFALAPVGPFAQSACAGGGPHHAALVIEHGNGSTIQRCVGFSSATITGDQLLQMSGIDFYATGSSGLGKAVCQIDGEPTKFSVCLPTSGSYWAMFVSRGGGSWAVSNLGISSQTFADGDAEGFRYDPQTGAPAQPPLPAPCPSPTPVPTPVPTPTPTSAATPRPAATPTPTSTATPRLAAGATPSRTPVASPTLAAGPPSSFQSPSTVQSPSAGAEAAPVADITPPPAAPGDATSTGDLTTRGALIALLALVVVTIGAARTRARLQSP